MRLHRPLTSLCALLALALAGCLTATTRSAEPQPEDPWTIRALPGDGAPPSLYAVTWTGSAFVAAGSGGALFTSPDGQNWTARSSGTPTDLRGVTVGPGRVVALGGLNTVTTSSDDGATWSAGVTGSTHNILRAVNWGGGRFVAVGDEQTVLTSPDGLAWTLRQYKIFQMRGVVWTGARHVVVGKYGTVLVSTDGIAWDSLNAGTGEDFFAVAWNGTRLAAVGNSGLVATSTDGLAWTLHASGVDESLFGITWTGGEEGKGHWVAVGDMGRVLTSPDGIVWTARPSNTSQRLYAVVSNGSRRVAVGENGAVLTSP